VVSLILSVVILGACVLAVAVEMLASSGDQPATGGGELRSAWEPWRSIVLGARDRLVAAIRALGRGTERAARRLAAGIGVGAAISRRASVRTARATTVVAARVGRATGRTGARVGRSTGRTGARAGRATGVAAHRGAARVAAAVAQAETSTLAAVALGTARTAAYTRRGVGTTGRGLARTAGGTAGVVHRMWGRAAGATTRGAQRTAAVTKRAARRLAPEPVALPGPGDAAAGPAVAPPDGLTAANTLTAAAVDVDKAASAGPPSTAESTVAGSRARSTGGREPFRRSDATRSDTSERRLAGPPPAAVPGARAEPNAAEAEPTEDAERIPAAQLAPTGAATTASEPVERVAVGAKFVPTTAVPAPAERVAAGNGAVGPRTRRRRRPRQGQVVPLRPRITTRLKATGELVVLVTFLGLVASSIIVALAVAANQALEGL
jgi:hypothetical protein